MDIDVTPLLERIESRLDRLGVPELEVLRTADLPPDLLDQLRAGKKVVPRGQRLMRLADALGTSVAYLVGLDPDAEAPAELLAEDQGNLGLLSGDEEALLLGYRRLDVSSRAALLLVVQKMAGPPADEKKRRT